MKNTIIAMLLCTTTVVYAEPVRIDKPIICDKTEEVFKVLETFGEMPVWGGNNSKDKTNYALMLNAETKSWTIVQFNTETACVLGIGDEHITNAENQ